MIPVPIDNRAVVFGIGANGNLGFAWDASDSSQTPPVVGWSAWQDLGVRTATPTLGKNLDGRLQVFAAGANGSLQSLVVTPDLQWSNPFQFAPRILTNPCAALGAGGLLVALAAGPSANLGFIAQTAANENTWSAWADVGSPPTQIGSDPAVILNGDDPPVLEVFAIGPTGTLGHVKQTIDQKTQEIGWAAWEDLGAVIVGPPTVARNEDGRIEVFAIGPPSFNLGHMWQTFDNELPPKITGWSAWEELGPAIQSAPAVGRNADGRLEVFAAGPSGTLDHMWQTSKNNGWSDWENLGPAIVGAPAVAQGLNVLAISTAVFGVFAVIGQMQQAPGGWTGWEVLEMPVQDGAARGLAAAFNSIQLP